MGTWFQERPFKTLLIYNSLAVLVEFIIKFVLAGDGEAIAPVPPEVFLKVVSEKEAESKEAATGLNSWASRRLVVIKAQSLSSAYR